MNESSEVALAFDDTELLPAIAQDTDTGDVLMLAYVTPEAIEKTLETGFAHYYSRSRDELWKKGGTSGHVQRVADVRVDCDGDTFLYRVEQEGGACHTGYESCFYQTLDSVDRDEKESTDPTDASAVTAETTVVGERVFDPDEAYE
ncbi:phosphoribosyl-AMP cyclohydrolase [Haladaptatus sp. T7]|uniref:phosphoribosyl-AMP cyclohydrolase n=1 Tax=Haladaptatus sp. T7 TaxID=2029368 RepID=UPI0021A25267|nr:phosphoribosyl-AMP cyclohydrolase [Haladaptatus sp. T7]GKZ14838.1 phosphoribosyl-AMP cyclohydrolase [Haladaptatus sp. T7]